MAKEKKDERVPLTKEEVEKKKAEMTEWHTRQIPFLETQLKYEDLLTKVQQSVTDRLEAEYKWLQIKAALMEKQVPQEINENDQPTPKGTPEMVQRKESTQNQPIHRTLKTE